MLDAFFQLSKSSKFISLTTPPRLTSNNIAVKRKNVDVQLTCVICIAAIVIILLGALAVFVLFGLNKGKVYVKMMHTGNYANWEYGFHFM